MLTVALMVTVPAMMLTKMISEKVIILIPMAITMKIMMMLVTVMVSEE